MKSFDIGILGGGQLARMSMMAAHRLGVSAVTLDPDPFSPAAQVGPALQGSISDAAAIAMVMEQCEVVTFENEFILGEVLRKACEIAAFDPAKVVPGIETLETIQDKLVQRSAFRRAGVPSPIAVPALDAAQLGFPCVLKSRFGGYDGKGTRFVKNESQYLSILATIEPEKWLAEEFVPFRQELAVMVCAGAEMHPFPTMVTIQKNHVCDVVHPATVGDSAALAQQVAIDAVRAVNGKGLFGVELFEHKDGSVSVNEIAPRPHNSGHYTIDWAGTSQFEAHILLSLGQFGGIKLGEDTCMVNIFGLETTTLYKNGLSALTEAHPEARMHWYGKKEAKRGRKMGHINVTGTSENVANALAARNTFLKAWGSN